MLLARASNRNDTSHRRRDNNGQMCGVKLQDRIPSKALRERHNFGSTAKQVAMVQACAAKRKQL